MGTKTGFSPEQDSIYISADQVRGALPWRLKDDLHGGALTDVQIAVLAGRLHVDREFLVSVSMGLAATLSSAYPSVIHMSRKVASERAAKELDKALAEVTVAERKLKLAVARLTPLPTQSSLDADGAARLERLKLALAETHRRSEEDLQELRAVNKVPNVALMISYTQKGQMQDRRRKSVMHMLFRKWQASGRKLTYTTDSVRKERTGPLIDFVRAVVACVTDLSPALSGETIVSDLRAFLSAYANDNSVTDDAALK